MLFFIFRSLLSRSYRCNISLAIDVAKFEKSISDRVESWFDTSSNEDGIEKNMPFDIGVVADFSGATERREEVRERDFAQITGAKSLDDMLSRLCPQVKLDLGLGHLGRGDSNSEPIEIEFEQMSDFLPEGILNKLMKNVNAIERIVALKTALKKVQWNLLEDETFRSEIEDRLQGRMS